MAPTVVFDTTALVHYAREDFQSLPVDELLQQVDDAGADVLIPFLAVVEAQSALADDLAALDRLEAFTARFGVRLADAGVVAAVAVLVEAAGVSQGLAHAMLLAGVDEGRELATYEAPLLFRVGYGMGRVLDLGEVFRS